MINKPAANSHKTIPKVHPELYPNNLHRRWKQRARVKTRAIAGPFRSKEERGTAAPGLR